MLRLATMLYAIVSSTLAGSFIVAALVAGFDTWQMLLGAAVVGAIAAVPVSYLVAKAIKAA